MLLHPFCFETEERVKEIVGISSQQCAGQPDDPIGA
jgi:hypothetical protein